MDEKEAKNWKGSEIKWVKYFTRTLDSNCSRNRVTPNVIIPHPRKWKLSGTRESIKALAVVDKAS